MHEIALEKDQATRLREIAGKSTGNHIARPTIFSVTSGKGGVGKSTIALNLALRMCDMSKRVLLFDADANLANIDVMLGVTPKYRLGDVLRGNIGLEEALVSPFPRLKFLAGDSGEIDYPEINGSVQENILRQCSRLRELPDYIIVDTSAGLYQEVINYSLFADESLIISSTEPTSIMDAYAMIKVISMSKPAHRFGLIINAALSPYEADEAAEKLQRVMRHFLKIDGTYLGYIPFDLNVRDSITHQAAVVQRFPRTQAAVSLQNLARKIILENKKNSERSRRTI